MILICFSRLRGCVFFFLAASLFWRVSRLKKRRKLPTTGVPRAFKSAGLWKGLHGFPMDTAGSAASLRFFSWKRDTKPAARIDPCPFFLLEDPGNPVRVAAMSCFSPPLSGHFCDGDLGRQKWRIPTTLVKTHG